MAPTLCAEVEIMEQLLPMDLRKAATNHYAVFTHMVLEAAKALDGGDELVTCQQQFVHAGFVPVTNIPIISPEIRMGTRRFDECTNTDEYIRAVMALINNTMDAIGIAPTTHLELAHIIVGSFVRNFMSLDAPLYIDESHVLQAFNSLLLGLARLRPRGGRHHAARLLPEQVCQAIFDEMESRAISEYARVMLEHTYPVVCVCVQWDRHVPPHRWPQEQTLLVPYRNLMTVITYTSVISTCLGTSRLLLKALRYIRNMYGWGRVEVLPNDHTWTTVVSAALKVCIGNAMYA